jgi:PAS domain S-box-containing protein
MNKKMDVDMLIRLLQSRYCWAFPILFWLILTSASLLWNLSLIDRSVKEIAFERGNIMFEMVRQTKINPLLMTNAPTLFKKQSVKDIQYRTVSANPINPENMADPWELETLTLFKKGLKYRFESFLSQEQRYFRFMGPVFVQKQCLDCHAYEGQQVGSVRGGISVKVMAKPIIASQNQVKNIMTVLHVSGFIVISLTSSFLIHLLRKHWLKLKKTQIDLKNKEQFLSDVTNSMSEGFVVLDHQGCVKYSNPECEWLIGWNNQEMLERKFSHLVYGDKMTDSKKLIESMINTTLHDGISCTGNDDVFYHKDGHRVDVTYSVSSMLRNSDDHGVVITFTDISERKRADEERRYLERQLNQNHKMEAVGQLAGGIAHEINTPIQYIGDNLRFLDESYNDIESILKAYSKLVEKAKQHSDLILEIDKIDEMIEEIDLDYLTDETPNAIAQSITGANQVADIVLAMKEFAHPGSKDKVSTDLNRIINNAVAVCKNEWKYVADTDLILSDALPEIKCLAGEIAQVILNLIVNVAHAIEATNQQQKGTITITSSVKDKCAEIAVQDTGTGIPKEVQSYVFNPFFTTKDVGRGTGQGLAIAQDIVVGKHQGELFFESEEGVGTTFIMRLPLSNASS